MLPPIDPRSLERNPNFDVLYKDLTTRKLNPDGSTRDTKKQRIHDEIRRVRQHSCLFIYHLHYLIFCPTHALDVYAQLSFITIENFV
jgi:hypothetical protein